MLECFIEYEQVGDLIAFEVIDSGDVYIGTLVQVDGSHEEHVEVQEYYDEDGGSRPFSYVTIEAEGATWQRGEHTWIIESIADALGLDKTVEKSQ